jgi:hypothetical protein
VFMCGESLIKTDRDNFVQPLDFGTLLGLPPTVQRDCQGMGVNLFARAGYHRQ